MGYDVMVTLHGVIEYVAMVLHGAENCTKITASCNHGVLSHGAMQCNHDAQW
jgi:hypothetical protein